MVMFNDEEFFLNDLIKKGKLAMKYSNFTTGCDLDDFYRFDRTISGFETNIYFDTCQSYKQMKHPLWFYMKNQDEYIPVDIDTKYMYYDGDIHVSDKGMQDISRFVDRHKDIIVALADEYITVSDFMDYLKHNHVKNGVLYEMSKMTPAETGLSMPIWVDENKSYLLGKHAKRLKFQSAKRQKKSDEYSSMEILGTQQIHNLPKNADIDTNDINLLRQFVQHNQDILSSLADAEITLDEFKSKMWKCGCDENHKKLIFVDVVEKSQHISVFHIEGTKLYVFKKDDVLLCDVEFNSFTYFVNGISYVTTSDNKMKKIDTQGNVYDVN